MSEPYVIFDRRALRQRRTRAAKSFHRVASIWQEACLRLLERLDDVNRHFATVVELGDRDGFLTRALEQHPKIGRVIACGRDVICDEEALPFATDRVDLVISCLGLHWVNDLPGTLIQIRRMLKPDGLFIASLPGSETLKELQAAFLAGSSEGVSPHVSPFVDIRDAGSLLQRAGFALPVTDNETLTLSYEHPLALMKDLRDAGETNLLVRRRKHFTPRTRLMAMMQHYPQNTEGRITATLELMTLTAWKPHAGQQQPAKRGSGQVSLTKALE